MLGSWKTRKIVQQVAYTSLASEMLKARLKNWIGPIETELHYWSRQGSRHGVVVIALASHLRGPGSGHEWVKLVKLVVGSLLWSERFFSGFSDRFFSGFSDFPLSPKINISKFQFDRMQDLPENHFRVSGASWVNINNYEQRPQTSLKQNTRISP